MKSLNMEIKLRLVSLLLVPAMVFCISSITRADSPERLSGPSPDPPDSSENSNRVIQPTKPTFAPPLGDVNSDSTDVRLRGFSSKFSNLDTKLSTAKDGLTPFAMPPSAGEPVESAIIQHESNNIDEDLASLATDGNSMEPWNYLPLPTLAEAKSRPHYVAGEIIVTCKPGVTLNAVTNLAGATNCSVVRKLKLHKRNKYLLKVKGNRTEEDVINQLKQNPDVLRAKKSAIFYTTGQKMPNDTYFTNYQWNLHQTSDHDIDAPEGWYEMYGRFGRVGDSGITIAILDSGIYYNHPDLNANMWVNWVEYYGTSGVDDDGNGYVDDVVGYDFVNDDPYPLDDFGHGTHVAGIASAVTDNSLGVAGVSWGCKVMAVKAGNNLGQLSAEDIAEGIDYAVNNGAWVINMSFGGTVDDEDVKEAIEDAYAYNVVLVASAGNDAVDLDVTKYYPACYDEVICVSATDKYDTYTGYTNYGSYVDVAAPGGKYATYYVPCYGYYVDYSQQIFSTWSVYPNYGYAYMYGTSMSCPHVAGLAALCLSKNPFLSNEDVKGYITAGTDDLGAAGKDDYYGYGRINTYGTLNLVPKIIYVDVDAPGDDDGSSWTDAYNELQNAFDDASSGDQIFVAKGTYYPDEGDSVTNNDRSATFQLKSGVAVRGAFAGYGETNPYYRNLSTYTTILSGDIDKNGVLDGDNSYNIVRGVDNALLEAFTITKGYANGTYTNIRGAGMYNGAANPMVASCTFSYNHADTVGGGMCNEDYSSPTIINCVFYNNDAYDGGGMANYTHSSPTLTNCIFNGNYAAYLGGGVYDIGADSVTITNCIFAYNASVLSAGGLRHTTSTSSLTLTNSLFIGNSTGISGGGVSILYSSTSVLTNCTFVSNSVVDPEQSAGGAMYTYDSALTVDNCIFWNDTAATGYGGEIAVAWTHVPTFSYCDIQGGLNGSKCYGTSIDGGNNINSNPLFGADGYHLTSSSPCIDVGDSSKNYSGQVDIDGDNRVINIAGKGDGNNDVDMGADEYKP